jgi:hypothetical protein
MGLDFIIGEIKFWVFDYCQDCGDIFFMVLTEVGSSMVVSDVDVAGLGGSTENYQG